MSIITRTGDDGTTALMYQRRVSKRDPRVEAYGTVDELNAALGLARAATPDPGLRERLLQFQHHLVTLMGELATHPDDLDRYTADGYPRLTAALTAQLETCARQTESGLAPIRGWVMPGSNPTSAALDLARTVCRRAERGACALQEAHQLANTEIVVFLNRLGDLLWLLARQEERSSTSPGAPCP